MNYYSFLYIVIIEEKTKNHKGSMPFLSSQDHWTIFSFKLVNIKAAADSLASEGLEPTLPSNEH